MIGSLLGGIFDYPQQQRDYFANQQQRQQSQYQMYRDMQAQVSIRFRYGLLDVAPQAIRPYNPQVKVIYRSKPTWWERLRG